MNWNVLLLAFSLVIPVAAQAPKEESVRPGINEKFLDPELKVDDWLKRFEVESREVFHARDAVLAACKIKPGMRVADIGAGTGLYTRMFADAVGKDGWVYAVDINGAFLHHIQARAKQEGHANISAILCPEDSVSLPPNSIDVAFACDTYHHFEYPMSTLASLLRALKPGGTFVVVDFKRIEGESTDWVLGHVRAGEEVFRKEIETAGLKFEEKVEVPGLEENYFLRFSKPAAP
ncbi:methyltransferase [Haloferula helveola]|uniref:Methyltransferase n=1 Tax=Haloferula helveola TaxID=490095 RepID=A0ABN6H2L4_9BACT|nr:methyltransferase [Haloferula helveola]